MELKLGDTVLAILPDEYARAILPAFKEVGQFQEIIRGQIEREPIGRYRNENMRDVEIYPLAEPVDFIIKVTGSVTFPQTTRILPR